MITEVKSHLQADVNVQTTLIQFNEGRYAGRYGVTVRDLDVNESVGLGIFLTLERAEAEYARCTAPVRGRIIDATDRFPGVPAAEAPAPASAVESIDRNAAIKRIRKALRQRTGRAWSVTGGRGTAWGWITIQAPPARRGQFGYMGEDDRATLAAAMGMEKVHPQGINIAAGADYRIEYVDRAEGREPRSIGTPYWD